MASLGSLKEALRLQATKQPLSDTEYDTGFDVLVRGSEAYQNFIMPQLTQVLSTALDSRRTISVLEVGPGPKSVLGDLPSSIRQKICSYTAFEPNELFASKLEERFSDLQEPSLPSLENPPCIYRAPFSLDTSRDDRQSFDIILFCHSMYGLHPHHEFIKKALSLLDTEREGALVVVFHRSGTLDLAGLVCHKITTFPTGIIRVADEDKELDRFATFIDEAFQAERRKACRALGRRDRAHPNELLFSAPEFMITFTRHATALPELTALVPLASDARTIKNRQARHHCPAAIIRPTAIEHIQQSVRWAIKHNLGLTVLGGGHSSHCIWPGVVAIDMEEFNKIHIFSSEENTQVADSDSDRFVLVESGCKTGDIISTTMKAGLTVPLGSRPSVGAGLYLQGGIGHLSRLYGLACDAIVGAVLVGVQSGQVLIIGKVPTPHRPAGAVCLENEADGADMLWAAKGAGANFGVVVSVVFKAFEAQKFRIRHWIDVGRNINYDLEAEAPRDTSIDTYIHWPLGRDVGGPQISATTFECFTGSHVRASPDSAIDTAFGPDNTCSIVDNVGLFETETYMSSAHGVHAGGKTSAFKRCLFFKEDPISIHKSLLASIKEPPSPSCYIHVLCGGGAIRDVAPDATAFGCRQLGCALVVTGVWPRDLDGTEAADAAVNWVYKVVEVLLPRSIGVYSADLGPDPRDVVLATRAFGQNLPQLRRLKHKLDPHNILAYACPLRALTEPKVIFMVTGDNCVGKDFCAIIWRLRVWWKNYHSRLRVETTSISNETKRAYAKASDADIKLLLHDRDYKELHRARLTAFFHDQLKQNPRLREEQFQNVVRNASNADVLFVTGLRDEAPVATLSHLAANSRIFDIRIEVNENTRRRRRGGEKIVDDSIINGHSCSASLSYRPDFIFHNNVDEIIAVSTFGRRYLFPLLDKNLEQLGNMIRLVPNFPRQGVDFRHVLDISQQPGGLALCTFLLQKWYTDDWDKVGAVVCCEAGGFIYASALALTVDKPLALIREAGKLPPPTVSIAKPLSHISSSSPHNSKVNDIEIGEDVVPKGVPLVIVDDVLATGETLCAVLELLVKSGVDVEHVTVMTIAEFPYHRGRYLLHERGFGRAKVQSLVVYGGA
ncbi:hypothetical protein F5Y08DRAFT_354108 [Xylaria arbuscula]|nr:hypothetical protein F5Y08DRAFT_354108 [Xylaria arbuscula]